MKSPLEYDESIVKEFGIKPEHEAEDEYKIGFVRGQLDEIKKFLWRERTELLMAEGQVKGDIEALAAKAQSDIAAHRSNIKGILLSIGTLNDLVKELEKKFEGDN